MTALAERIARLIAAQGPLSIAQFMTVALHDPRSGYYATRDPFGRGGDFITAPEVSQMFGEMIGLWMVQAWRHLGEPASARLVELGPGRGTLMADALRAAKVMPEFLKAIEVVLVEASPTLRTIQEEKFAGAAGAIRWTDRFDDSLNDRPLFLIANEFFDALPVRQFVSAEDGWHERMVTVKDGNIAFALAPAPTTGLFIPGSRDPAEPGAVYESSAAAMALTEEIAGIVAAKGGAALVVDYGYDGAGYGDTLQAVRGHASEGVLDNPGDADLSAHVDFAALAQAARAAGATPWGPAAQGDFLTALGIVQRTERLAIRKPDQGDIWTDLERLILPDQMGSLFKVLAILPANAPKPEGF